MAGCGLHPDIVVLGGNEMRGCLLNHSCGAHPCDPIDPSKPTIVLTHGFNPLPRRLRTTFMQGYSRAIKCRCGDSYNLLGWDWNRATWVSLKPQENVENAIRQGRCLAAALRARGVVPQNTHLIAHSLGSVTMAAAAQSLSRCGCRVAQLTLLDPLERQHQLIFERLEARCSACEVENYWAPGLTGYGGPARYRNVRNYRVAGRKPIWGIIDPTISNHVSVLHWYYDTIRCPRTPCGFQNSVFVHCCGATQHLPPVEELPLFESDADLPWPQLAEPPLTADRRMGARRR